MPAGTCTVGASRPAGEEGGAGVSELSDQDHEQLEAAADEQTRLHIIVHGNRSLRSEAARRLSELLSNEAAEHIVAEKSRWTIKDSRRCLQAARRSGGPLVCDIHQALGRDLDPLLLETERPEGRNIIIGLAEAPAATLKGRGTLILLAPAAAGRRRQRKPSSEEARQRLLEDAGAVTGAGALMREHADSAWGARMADSILRDRGNADLPADLRLELLLDNLNVRHKVSEARSETSSST